MLTVQQESMFQDRDFREFKKCGVCPKVFVNESFLASHVRRRHKDVHQEHLRSPSQHGQYGQSDREELKHFIEELKNYLPKTKTDDYTFIAEMVKSQQDQINQLHSMLKDRPGRRDHLEDEGEGTRLQAQEILWQSKIKAVEENFSKSLLESEEKMRILQTEFEIEKDKLKKGQRRERRRRRKAEILKRAEERVEERVEERDEERDDDLDHVGGKSTPAGDKPVINAVPDNSPKSLAKLQVSEVETDDETDNISKASQEELNENQVENTGINEKDEADVPIKNSVSTVSLKSDHMYETPLSFRSSKEDILELIDKNPSRIDQYRTQVKTLLADQMEQLGVDSKASKMSQDDFSLRMRQIKDYRRRLSNSSEIGDLRAQYKEEVDTLASQSSLKHGSLKKRLSKGMSSFRKQIFRSLQNLNSTKHQQKSFLSENKTKKKSPKKKLAPPPPPPPTLFKRVSSTESCSLKPDNHSNVYVESPVRLPPKPAPRASKITEVVQKFETPPSSSSEDSEEEFEEHIDIGESGNNKININTIEVHRNGDSEDDDEEDTFDNVENLTDNKSATDNEEKDSEDRDVIDRTFEADASELEEDEEDTAANDKTFSWDSEDNDNIAEIENVDMSEERKTEIKLSRPRPGSKIADLTNIIESQLYRRAARPTGGVDPLQAAMERCEEEVGTDLSTNTLPTSQWVDNGSEHTSRPCSANTFPSLNSRPASGHLAPPLHRRMTTSWDSD